MRFVLAVALLATAFGDSVSQSAVGTSYTFAADESPRAEL